MLAELPAPGDEAEAIDRTSLLESPAQRARPPTPCGCRSSGRPPRLSAEYRSSGGAGVCRRRSLARRASGNAGGRYLGFARAMGETATAFARLREGSLSEWRATITQHADGPVGDGDRNHAQIMADTLVERLTGTTRARMSLSRSTWSCTADVLVGGAPAAADVPGHGPVPADTARALIVDALDAEASVTLRRLFAARTRARSWRWSPARGSSSRIAPVRHPPRRVVPDPVLRCSDRRDRPPPPAQRGRGNRQRQRQRPVPNPHPAERSRRLGGHHRDRRRRHP